MDLYLFRHFLTKPKNVFFFFSFCFAFRSMELHVVQVDERFISNDQPEWSFSGLIKHMLKYSTLI